ncbi:MAG: hypothetical protein ACSHX5_05755 [Phycisphaerales bacterium]
MTRTVSDSNPSISKRVMQTTALSDRVARVLLVRSWIRESLGVLPWSIGVGLICVLVVRWLMGDSRIDGFWFGFPITAVLVAVGLGFVRAWSTRPTRTSAAGWFDESAHTQSRFRSALELAAAPCVDTVFADIAVDAAERDARGAIKSIPNQGNGVAWHERPAFLAASVLMVLTLVAGIWMPQRSSPEPTQLTRSVQTIDEAQEHVQAKQEQLLEAADLASEDDELVQQALEDLSEIEQELVSSNSSEPDSATALADSRIQRLADELEQRSEQQEQEEQALREKLDKLRNESLSDSSDLERFREQLAEGQYEDAIEELEALNESMDSMTPEQREQAARDLESLANAIEDDSPISPSEGEPGEGESNRGEGSESDPAKELSESMREEAEKLRESASEREPSNDEQAPADTEEAEQAQENEPEQNSDPASEQSQKSQNESAEEESEQTENQASETNQSEPEQSESEQSESEQGESQQGQEGSKQRTDPSKQDESGQEPSDTQDSSSEQESKQQGQENQQSDQQQGNEQGEQKSPQEQQGAESEERTGDESGERSKEQTEKQSEQEAEQETEQESEQQSGEESGQEPGESAQEQGEQGQEQGSEQGQDQSGDQAAEQDSEQTSDKASDRATDRASDQESAQDAPGKETDLKEMLRQAQRRSEGAQRDREMSERLREQIEEAADREDGAQRDQPQDQNNNSEQSQGSQGSQESEAQENPQSGSQGDPAERANSGSTAGQDDPREMNPEVGEDQSEYVPVQAADENSSADEDSTPLGRWYNPDQDGARSATGKSDTAQRFRDASKKAREEVSDRRVPRKYRDVISEYFKKLDERAGKLAPSSASSDGQDAPSPKKSSSSGGSD